MLSSNNLAELADLDALAGFPRLTHLVLADNPASKKEVSLGHCRCSRQRADVEQNYRYWVLWRCPSVRFLDHEKVKEAEREKARELFGTEEEPTALASKVHTHTHNAVVRICTLTTTLSTQIMGIKTTSFSTSADGSEAPSKLSRIKLTDAEKKRLQERIKKATSLQEIIALEKELNEGRLPSGIHGDAMEE